MSNLTKRILVAEYHDQVQLLLSRQLHNWGCQIVLATTASEVIADLKRYDPFDCLIVSHQLPALNGIDLLFFLRQEKLVTEKTKVLILSGSYDAEEVAEQARKLGADFLRKPYESSELRSALSQFLPVLVQ